MHKALDSQEPAASTPSTVGQYTAQTQEPTPGGVQADAWSSEAAFCTGRVFFFFFFCSFYFKEREMEHPPLLEYVLAHSLSTSNSLSWGGAKTKDKGHQSVSLAISHGSGTHTLDLSHHQEAELKVEESEFKARHSDMAYKLTKRH